MTLDQKEKAEHMREVMSDITMMELAQLFDALDTGDVCHVGILATRMLHSAVENYHSERKETYARDNAVDDGIDRMQLEQGR